MTLPGLRSIYNPDCRRCHLYEHARHICMSSSGTVSLFNALIVGEAPGRNEDIDGVPFIGQAGRILDKALVSVGISREEIVVTNAVKCRPVANRTPEADEIDACSAYLAREIEALDAYVILALGNVAAQALLGLSGITSIRGTWHELDSARVRWVMPTYHPAYVLRKGLGSEVHQMFNSDIETFMKRAQGARSRD